MTGAGGSGGAGPATETVPPALDGERVDRVVALLTGLPRAEVAALVAAGGVRLGGRPVARRSARVAAGDHLAVDVPVPAAAALAPDPAVPVAVVHADAHVIVVDKPPGLVVHPGAGQREGTLAQGLLARFPELAGVGEPGRPGIVHRLDKGTSGLLVVARTPAAHAALGTALRRHHVERRYLALAWGAFEAPRGLVDAPVGRAARHPTRMAVSRRGRDARTRYQVERAYTDPAALTLVSCELETGRTHQIRVHLAAIGHPVVGDDRYGGTRPPLAAPRPFLHAHSLRLAHPVSGEILSFTSPLPADLEGVLAGLT